MQGNEGMFQQSVPAHFGLACQHRIGRHHRHETVDVQRGECQRRAGFRLEGDPDFHLAVTDHFHHLLVDHVMHGDADRGVAVAKGAQYGWQQITGEGRHRGQRHPALFQGETLAQLVLGVVPVGEQPTRLGQ